MERKADVSELLRAAQTDPELGRAAPELFSALYDELHRLAGRQIRRGGGSVTLSTTTLLHEAYLNICDRVGAEFPDRARFIGYAARAMRGIVIDHIRYSHAQNRGGNAVDVPLTGAAEAHLIREVEQSVDVHRLSDALDRLAELEPSLAELVDLRFFCGYELREIATLRGVSERTVQRSWRKARLLLRQQLDAQPVSDRK
jgi:RNA polymerase sigma factor (TIGR02999 family)